MCAPSTGSCAPPPNLCTPFHHELAMDDALPSFPDSQHPTSLVRSPAGKSMRCRRRSPAEKPV
eukprot:scaffold517_cov255-Pinguiococcus_pyrenoidosus.AAC.31